MFVWLCHFIELLSPLFRNTPTSLLPQQKNIGLRNPAAHRYVLAKSEFDHHQQSLLRVTKMKMMFDRKRPSLLWMVTSRWAALGLGWLILVGCDRSGQRLKEKAIPNPLVQSKPQTVKGDSLERSKQALKRSAKLGPAAAAHILQGFHYKATATYKFKKDTRTLELVETLNLAQDAKGDFHLTLNNNQKKGYEVIWSNKTLYQRMRHRPFRVTSHNAGDARRWQMRSFGRWRSIVMLFGAQMGLTKQGLRQHMGRTCQRYEISLLGDPQKPLKFKEGTAWKGPAPDHTRGAAAKKTRTPLAAKGELWVDTKTGLPLKVKFRGRYRIGTAKDNAVGTIELKASFNARSGVVEKPKEVSVVKREIDAHDAFGRKKPTFMLPPPSLEEQRKRRRRRRRRRR